MKYDRELNELLLNIQRNMTEKQANNATADQRHYQRTLDIKRETSMIEMMIKSYAKDTSGLDTKKSC